MKKLIISFIVMVLSTITINAQGVGIADMNFEPGETKVLAITFGNATSYTAFQMDVKLPAGFSISTIMNEDNEEVLDISIDVARKKSTHQLSYKKIADNVYRLVVFSSNNATFKGTTEAPFVNIGITASADIALGNYTVTLTNVSFTTPTPEDIAFDDFNGILNVVDDVVVDKFIATVTCAPEGDAMLSTTVVTSGSPLKLLVAPNNGYKVATLKLNGNAVGIENNVYNIEAVAENVAFDVTFEAIVPDTVEVEKIVIDTLVVEKLITDTIEIETIEIDTVYIAEINEVPVPEISFADGMLNISCSLQGAKIFYTLDGSVPTTASEEYIAPVAVSENCTVMAIAVVASEVASQDIVITGIGGVADEIVSCRYFTETGVEIDNPLEGINIMIVEYASGKIETKKVVVRKK